MAKRSSSASAVLTPEPDHDILVFDAADELMTHPFSGPLEDDVQAKVKEHKEELLQLRLRQEEIERQTQQLEIIRQKKDRFGKGKRDMLERLTQATVKIGAELYSSEQLVRELADALDTYEKHANSLRDLQSDKWQRAHVEEELDRALAIIGEAETDYSKFERRLKSVRPQEQQPEPVVQNESSASSSVLASDDLMSLAKRGFAFTLPLMAAMLIVLVLARLMF